MQQVHVPGLVFSQQQQVIRIPVQLWVAVSHPPRRHVRLQPDHRLHASLVRRLVEVDHAEHGSVIGDRHRRHLHLFDTLHQLLDVAESIQQRVLGVYVQMRK